MAIKLTKQDWTVGAVYRLASRRRFERGIIASLLVSRAGFSERKAIQLVCHWLTTESFRMGR